MTHNNTATTELDRNAAEQATAFIKPEGVGEAYRITFYFYKTGSGRVRLKGFLGHTGSDFDAQPFDVLGGSIFADAWQRYASNNKAIKGFIAEYASTLLQHGYIDSKGNWSRLKSDRLDVLNAFDKCGWTTDSTCIFIGSQECRVNICNRKNA